MLFRITARSRATSSSRTNSGEIAAAASAGAVGVTGVDCGAASRAGLASSRVLVADSNVSTPANAAAAITALMNFNITGYMLAAPKLAIRKAAFQTRRASRRRVVLPSLKGSVQTVCLRSSHTPTSQVLAVRAPNTLASSGGSGCSTQITHRLNLTAVDELCGTGREEGDAAAPNYKAAHDK